VRGPWAEQGTLSEAQRGAGTGDTLSLQDPIAWGIPGIGTGYKPGTTGGQG